MGTCAVVDAEKQVMRCKICGDTFPIQLGDVQFVAAVMGAFSDAHPDTPHTFGRTEVQNRRPRKALDNSMPTMVAVKIGRVAHGVSLQCEKADFISHGMELCQKLHDEGIELHESR